MDLKQYNLTQKEETQLNDLMSKYKNDDEYFAQMNREVTSFMILRGRKSLNGRRPTPEEMLLALLVSGRF